MAISKLLETLTKTEIKPAGATKSSSVIKAAAAPKSEHPVEIVPKIAVYPSDDALRQTVADANMPSYDAGAGKIEVTAEGKINSLTQKLEDKTAAIENSIESAHDAFVKNDTKTLNSALKRGIYNSSIYESVREAVNNDYIRNIKLLNETLEATKAGMEAEMAVVNRQKELALQEFDIKYAAELEKKVQAYVKAEHERIDKLNAAILELYEAERKVARGEYVL